MFLTYIKIAFRSLLRNKVFTAINIIGLSVGAASSLIIFLYVQDELSYDKNLPDSDRIYRLVEDRKYPDRLAHFAWTPSGWATVFPAEIPEVELTTRVAGLVNPVTIVKYKDNIFREESFFCADSNFFTMFPYKLLKGNPKSVLRHPNTIVLTASTAARYFGEENPIGKSIEAYNIDNEVVGVMEDLPENSHMKFDALFPTGINTFVHIPDFYRASSYTYVKLFPNSDPKAVEQKIVPLVEKYAAGPLERAHGVSYSKFVANGNGYTYLLQPIQDIHLTSHRLYEMRINGSTTVVSVLIMICLLILAIAAINFVNLATARSSERAKEVGIRKTLGSRRKHLVLQFLSESMMVSTFSIVIAVIIVQGSLNYFNNTYGKVLHLSDNPMAIAVLLVVTLMLGLASGVYPALYISSLKAVQVLKGKFQASSTGNFLRNGLVVFQFTVSVILISATLIVFDQLGFMQSKSLGFDKQNLIIVNYTDQNEKTETLQDELRNVPGVVGVTSADAVPGGFYFSMPLRPPGSEEIFYPKAFSADDHFAGTIGLKMAEGRWFGVDHNDSLAIVINQRAAMLMNLSTPVGTVLTNNTDPTATIRYTIVGVVEDFNYESLHREIAPLVITSTEAGLHFNLQNAVIARVNGSDFENTLLAIETKWKTHLPDEIFNYSTLDNHLKTLYRSEETAGRLLTTFSVIAIIVACVGLFGLTAYTASQRTKEIGVRKVLGATISNIVELLSRDFARLVLLSLIIGAPVAWYCMHWWLESFAFRVPLNALPFLKAGVIVSLFTAVTISYQSIKAALLNPVESLKEN